MCMCTYMCMHVHMWYFVCMCVCLGYYSYSHASLLSFLPVHINLKVNLFNVIHIQFCVCVYECACLCHSLLHLDFNIITKVVLGRFFFFWFLWIWTRTIFFLNFALLSGTTWFSTQEKKIKTRKRQHQTFVLKKDEGTDRKRKTL